MPLYVRFHHFVGAQHRPECLRALELPGANSNPAHAFGLQGAARTALVAGAVRAFDLRPSARARRSLC